MAQRAVNCGPLLPALSEAVGLLSSGDEAWLLFKVRRGRDGEFLRCALLQGSGRIGTAYTATGLSGGIHTLQSGHVMAAFCTNLRAPMGVYHYATPDLHPLVRGSGHHSVSTSWTRAMRRWEQLHYCQRCNGVFIPSESPLVPVPQMRNFLYRPPASPVARAASR